MIMSMVEIDLITLTIIILICLIVYLYCLRNKPHWLKYVSIGYIILLVFIGL